MVLKGTKAYGEQSSPENQIITTTKTTSQRTTAEKWLKPPLPQAQILGETDFQGGLTVDIVFLQSYNADNALSAMQGFFQTRNIALFA